MIFITANMLIECMLQTPPTTFKKGGIASEHSKTFIFYGGIYG